MIYHGHIDQTFGPITYSHNGEDLLALNLFRNLGIVKPSYLDIGCHHPVHGSNTFLLYRNGSRGVCVDANFQFEAFFAYERPGDRFVFGAIGVNRGVIPFYMRDTFSGRNTCCESEFRRAHHGRQPEIDSVSCYRIEDIVSGFCDGKWPDFLSCDLEGSDADVIADADFIGEAGPKIICVEANTERDIEVVSGALQDRGYHALVRFGVNCFFIASQLYHSAAWKTQP